MLGWGKSPPRFRRCSKAAPSSATPSAGLRRRPATPGFQEISHRGHRAHRENYKEVFLTESELNSLTEKIIGTAIEVHKELGPGLLEKVYQCCLKIALEEKGLHVEAEVPVPLSFHGQKICDDSFRLDLLVENQIIIELKSVSKVTDLFKKQLGTYLKLAEKPCGLLINFNEVLLKNGISRILNGYLSK